MFRHPKQAPSLVINAATISKEHDQCDDDHQRRAGLADDRPSATGTAVLVAGAAAGT
jgi:hypothetical protein